MDSLIVLQRYCEVDMSIITSNVLNLEEGDLIQILASAFNGIGYSELSDPNTSGQLAQVPPKKPPQPPTRNVITSRT